jgi:DNA-binding MarR family transcriptional regulator
MEQGADITDVVGESVMQGVEALARRLRQIRHAEDEPTYPERAALTRLEGYGPATSADLARAEQITPQSMGVTLAALESRGLVKRSRDPGDGRRIIYSLTEAGAEWKRSRRGQRAELLGRALAEHFTSAEIEQLGTAAALIERLASSI